jgi:protein lysine acetyltransferase
VIRSIRPDDGPRLQRAYLRLSPQSRYQRFMISKPRLTEADTRYLVEVDGQDHVALVAVDANDPESIIGVARFVRGRDDRDRAELAVVVGDPFQGEGLGTELVRRLAVAARERGIERLTATMLAQNPTAHRLVGDLSDRELRVRSLGEVDEVEVDLGSLGAGATELAMNATELAMNATEPAMSATEPATNATEPATNATEPAMAAMIAGCRGS